MDTAGRSCHQKGCGQSKGKATPGSAETFQCGASRRPERSPRHGARRRKRLQRESAQEIQEAIRTASPNPSGAAPRRRRIGSRPGVGSAQGSSFCARRHARGSVDQAAQEKQPSACSICARSVVMHIRTAPTHYVIHLPTDRLRDVGEPSRRTMACSSTILISSSPAATSFMIGIWSPLCRRSRAPPGSGPGHRRAMRGGEVRRLRPQHTRGADPWRRPTAPARRAGPRRCRRAPRAARSPSSSPRWS